MLVSYIVSVVLIVILFYSNGLFLIKETLIEIKNNESDVLFNLYIPRIKLQERVYTIDSSLNDVDYHVEILEGSDLGNNLFFLASHSGSGRASYFDNLVYLEKGDIIWINSANEKFVFAVEDIFYIQKNGYFDACYNDKGDTLFLITCSLEYVDKQVVVRAKLIYEC